MEAPKRPESVVLCHRPFAVLIRLPGRPATPNNLLRAGIWRTAGNANKWKQMVRTALGANMPPQCLKAAKITARRYSGRPLDYDGLVGSLKPLIDGVRQVRIRDQIVWPGVIEDDAWKVTGPWDVGQEYWKGETFYEILIEESQATEWRTSGRGDDMKVEEKKKRPYSANYAMCMKCKEHPTEHRTGVCINCRKIEKQKAEARSARMREL